MGRSGWGTGDGQFWYPFKGGIAADTNGNVYAADYADFYNFRIEEFNSNGVYLAQLGAYGAGAGQFIYPMGVALDSSGNVYVADTGNNRIEKFTSNGNYLTQSGGLARARITASSILPRALR